MPEIILNHIDLIQSFSYLGVFVAVVLAGHFVPIPEDISLIAAGYLAAIGFANIWIMFLIGMTAPVVADLLLFYLSTIGSRFAPRPEKYENSRMFQFVRHHMHNNTVMTVILMRFVTGFRFMSPVVGAYINVPVKKYLFANIISAALYGPFFVFLGYKLHKQITSLIKIITSIEHTILVLVGVGIVVAIALFLKNRKGYNTTINAEE